MSYTHGHRKGKTMTQNVAICKKCKKMFHNISDVLICPQCMEKLEEDYKRVREYLDDNPRATKHEIAKACQVEAGQIEQWFREGKFQYVVGTSVRIPCEKCGAMISSGNLCEKCAKNKEEIIQDLSARLKESKKAKEAEESKAAAKKGKKKDGKGEKMHFINKRK